MGRLGVLYHMDTCIACGACQTACKDGHGLIGGEFFRRVEMIETDEGYLPLWESHVCIGLPHRSDA